jgi:hypothetical protein
LRLRSRNAACENFEELHDVIVSAVRDIWNNAELYCYDTALRIGARINFRPDTIYLHRGTRQGARRLGLTARGLTLQMSELPKELRVLEPEEVEDVLCIYKHLF